MLAVDHFAFAGAVEVAVKLLVDRHPADAGGLERNRARLMEQFDVERSLACMIRYRTPSYSAVVSLRRAGQSCSQYIQRIASRYVQEIH